MSFIPIGNRVLLKRKQEDEKSQGGLLLPDSAKKKQDQFEIVALGTSNYDEQGNVIDFPISVGDIVMIDKYVGQEVQLNEEIFLIVRVNEISCKLS